VDRKWRQRWRRGRPDLLRLIAEGGYDSHHGLRLARSLLSETPRTWPHLNKVGPRVEEGRPRCICTLILVGAAAATTTTAITTAAPVAAAVTTVVLLAGLLWWALLLLLLWGGGHRPTERSWRRWWLGRGVERSGGSSGRLQPPAGFLLNTGRRGKEGNNVVCVKMARR
jgi:hypothetical protein